MPLRLHLINQDPDDYRFNHPLQAEVHELKIYNKYRTDAEIVTGSKYGVENILSESNLQFYVPPFFVKDTNQRTIFQTPFQTAYGSTDDPFNVPLSFGVGGQFFVVVSVYLPSSSHNIHVYQEALRQLATRP